MTILGHLFVVVVHAHASEANRVGLRVQHSRVLRVRKREDELRPVGDVVRKPVVLGKPVPKGIHVVKQRLLPFSDRLRLVQIKATNFRRLVFFVLVRAKAVEVFQLKENKLKLVNGGVCIVDRQDSEAWVVIVARGDSRHYYLDDGRIRGSLRVWRHHVDVVDVRADREHVVLLKWQKDLHELIREIGVPEQLFALVVIAPEEHMDLRHKLHVRVGIQRVVEPVEHEFGPVFDLHTIVSERVDSIQRDEHQIVCQLVSVVASSHPSVHHGLVGVDGCVSTHIFEEDVLQLSIVLSLILQFRRHVVVVAVVVADSW